MIPLITTSIHQSICLPPQFARAHPASQLPPHPLPYPPKPTTASLLPSITLQLLDGCPDVLYTCIPYWCCVRMMHKLTSAGHKHAYCVDQVEIAS